MLDLRKLLPTLLLGLAAGCGGEDVAEPDGPGSSEGQAGATGGSAAPEGPTNLVGGPEGGPDSGVRRSRGFEPGGTVPDERLGDYHVVMDISIDGEPAGQMAFGFWPEIAPITVRNFLRHVDEGFYDSLIFHRIMREFMVQGGCPDGSGAGNGPHEPIVSEAQTQREYAHGYGVLSMAQLPGNPDSATSQFFLCCADNRSVWGLDGSYATFGRLTRGVDTLEALATIPVELSPRGEPSVPSRRAVIEKATVVEGPAPTEEGEVARPRDPEDEGPAPEVRQVALQDLLIAVDVGGMPGITRTREEAAALAEEVAARAREEGADFRALVREYGDLPVPSWADDPGYLKLLNEKVRDTPNEREVFDRQRDANRRQSEAQSQVRRGLMTVEEYRELSMELLADQKRWEQQNVYRTYGAAPRGVAAAVFTMQPGEVRVIEYSPTESPRGYHVLKRVE